MTQLLHKACECVFRKGRVGGDISMSTLQCNEHHPSQTYIEAVTCGFQSQRRRSPCCHWPRTPCFKATFYSLLRAFLVCWQMLLALPLLCKQLPSLLRLPSILVPATLGSLTVPNSPSHAPRPSFHQCSPVVLVSESCREAHVHRCCSSMSLRVHVQMIAVY